LKQPIPVFEAHVVDKKMKMLDYEKAAVVRWVATFQNGTKLDVVIRKQKAKRTNDQNAYYWGVVIPILSDYFGHDNPEDMHEDLKQEFNPIESKVKPGTKIGGTTTKLSTVDFFSAETSYVERICRWAVMEHGLYVPPPKKVEP